MANQAREAALAAAREAVIGEEAPAEEQVSDTEAPAVEADGTIADLAFDLDPEVPEEIQALVDEPDFEAEAEEQLEQEEWELDEDEYLDPRLAEERKKRIALEKRLAHVEGQRVKDARGKWEAEAEKFYPLANAKQIDATSRRAFLRAAKQQHDANKPFIQRAIAVERAKLEEERAGMEQAIRAEFESAWGKPLGDRAQVPELEPERAKKVDDAFSRSFTDGVKEFVRQGG